MTYIDGIGYLSNNYQPIINDDGTLSAPKEYVSYWFMNYPTFQIGTDRILSIVITDPNVSVWGLTINSSKEEMVEIFNKIGFDIDGPGKHGCRGEYGNIEVDISYNTKITIHYNVVDIINTIYFGQISYN